MTEFILNQKLLVTESTDIEKKKNGNEIGNFLAVAKDLS